MFDIMVLRSLKNAFQEIWPNKGIDVRQDVEGSHRENRGDLQVRKSQEKVTVHSEKIIFYHPTSYRKKWKFKVPWRYCQILPNNFCFQISSSFPLIPFTRISWKNSQQQKKTWNEAKIGIEWISNWGNKTKRFLTLLNSFGDKTPSYSLKSCKPWRKM